MPLRMSGDSDFPKYGTVDVSFPMRRHVGRGGRSANLTVEQQRATQRTE